jgi:hypothetical protein
MATVRFLFALNQSAKFCKRVDRENFSEESN